MGCGKKHAGAAYLTKMPYAKCATTTTTTTTTAPRSCLVTVYKHSGFRGTAVRFGPGVSGGHFDHDLKTWGFGNDWMSSMRVEGSGDCRTTVFEHDRFNGRSVTFAPGSYDLSTLERYGVRNDWVPSLKVFYS